MSVNILVLLPCAALQASSCSRVAVRWACQVTAVSWQEAGQGVELSGPLAAKRNLLSGSRLGTAQRHEESMATWPTACTCELPAEVPSAFLLQSVLKHTTSIW
jgi:hypothetical protein